MADKKDEISGISRRDLLQMFAGVGMSAVVGGSIALPEHVRAQIAKESASRPRRGGRIRVACISSSTADTLDPARGSLSTDYTRHYMVYSGLTQFDENMDPQLALADSIETSDQQLWTIGLRKGVVFHDGKSLTPADVVYSLMRHKDPELGAKMAAVAAQIESVKETGPHQVQIRLTSPNADLPAILGTSHFLIIQDGVTDFRTAVGAGPYKVKEFTPGVRTICVRNENYWKPGKPYLDEIELIGIPDETSRVSALLAGDVQLVNALDPRSTRRVNGSPGHAILETKSGLYTNLIMRQDVHPTGNPDFTLAMKYLFDRKTIKRALFRGYGTIANDHPVPPSHRYHANDLPQRPYDPDRAKFLLKKAGITGARLPVFVSPAAAGSVDMAALMQLSAGEAGLKLGINRVPADGYWSNHWAKHPLSFGNVNPRPTVDLLFSLFFKSDAPWNESRWHNEKFDQLLIASRAEGDETKRKQMYVDMQVLVHEQCGIGIPLFMSLIDGYDTRLKGLGTIPIGGLMGYSFAEYVWLDA